MVIIRIFGHIHPLYLMPVFVNQKYKNWAPVAHNVFKDDKLTHVLHEKGYVVVPFLDAAKVQELKDFYAMEHRLSVEKGAMFYSLYSKDLDYRQRVHETIAGILKPFLDAHFVNYKNIVNTFITKISGQESEFYVHQDSTALDEYRHSPLSVWIPLQDITPENGALAVVEKTHWFFSPYRGITIKQPFQSINNHLKAYLKPIYMKAGEAIIFDPRIVHNSVLNTSGTDRLVVLCGVFPEEAEFVTCYKGPDTGNKIELIKHDDSFVLKNETFFYDCHTRPKTGTVLRTEEDDFPEMSWDTFETLCEMNEIPKPNQLTTEQQIKCQFIAEPDGVNLNTLPLVDSIEKPASVWQKIKEVFTRP